MAALEAPPAHAHKKFQKVVERILPPDVGVKGRNQKGLIITILTGSLLFLEVEEGWPWSRGALPKTHVFGMPDGGWRPPRAKGARWPPAPQGCFATASGEGFELFLGGNPSSSLQGWEVAGVAGGRGSSFPFLAGSPLPRALKSDNLNQTLFSCVAGCARERNLIPICLGSRLSGQSPSPGQGL